MNSHRIKLIVAQVNLILGLLENGDHNKIRDELNELLLLLISSSRKSPIFAVAVINYLEERGIDSLVYDSPAVSEFKEKFSKALMLDRKALSSIKKITSKLFAVKDCHPPA